MQATIVLVPSHLWPTSQGRHDVRVVAVPPSVRYPAVHFVHSACPGLLNRLSPPHALTVLEPSHEYPAAHEVHEDRVLASPPAVLDPGAHVLHELAPASDAYILSFPQLAHAVPALLANVPRLHIVDFPLPSHAKPVGHASHLVRVTSVLPEVKNPGPQVLQLPSPGVSVYAVSLPQFEHVLDPGGENLPAGHTSLSELPSHFDPPEHVTHPDRVVLVPPVV